MLAAALSAALSLGSRKAALVTVQIDLVPDMPDLVKVMKLESPSPFIPFADDQGYFEIHDRYRSRYMYVCTIDIGKNPSFLHAYQIENVLDLSKEPEEHFEQQTPSRRRRSLHGIIHCLNLLLDSSGNVVIHCRNGRTRSPVVVAAYLMVVSCLSQKAAYGYVSSELLEQRNPPDGCGIDRAQRYVGHLNELCKLVDNVVKVAPV